MPKIKQTIKTDFFKDLDLIPSREQLLEQVRNIAKRIGAFYGFQKISTSVIEEYKRFSTLIKEGLFELSPPVVVKTKTGIDILLRSSGVLGALRVYSDYGMFDLPQPVKLLFEGESFSSGMHDVIIGQYEFGFLMVGEGGPVAEVELFQVVWKTLEELGVRADEASLRLNAIGCGICRASFRSVLGSYFRSRINRLCKNCKRDVKKSPTRILVCGEEKCRIAAGHAPQILDYLCEMCKKHLRGMLEFLDEIKVPYFLDHMFFREGSLYSQLIFEFLYNHPVKKRETETGINPAVLDAEIKEVPLVIAEGGRVTHAAELITLHKTDAVAVKLLLASIERILLLRNSPLKSAILPKVFLVQLGELARRKSIAVIEMLRHAGIETTEILGKDSIKTQLNNAEKMGVPLALILGQKEALDETIIVREVDSGVQETIPQEKLIGFLQRKLSKT